MPDARQYHAIPAQQLLDQILLQARLFTGKQNFVDDVSLVVMKVKQQKGTNTDFSMLVP